MLRKVASGGAAVETSANVLGLLVLPVPMDLAIKYPVLTVILGITLVADFVVIGYLLWRQPAVAPAVYPTARQLRGGVYAAMIAALLTMVGLVVLWLPLGLGYGWTVAILAVILLITLAQDIIASVVVIR